MLSRTWWGRTTATVLKRSIGVVTTGCYKSDKVTTSSERECGTSPRLCFWAHTSRYVYRA